MARVDATDPHVRVPFSARQLRRIDPERLVAGSLLSGASSLWNGIREAAPVHHSMRNCSNMRTHAPLCVIARYSAGASISAQAPFVLFLRVGAYI